MRVNPAATMLRLAGEALWRVYVEGAGQSHQYEHQWRYDMKRKILASALLSENMPLAVWRWYCVVCRREQISVIMNV